MYIKYMNILESSASGYLLTVPPISCTLYFFFSFFFLPPLPQVFGFQAGLTCQESTGGFLPLIPIIPSFSTALYGKLIQMPEYWWVSSTCKIKENLCEPRSRKSFLCELRLLDVNWYLQLIFKGKWIIIRLPFKLFGLKWCPVKLSWWMSVYYYLFIFCVHVWLTDLTLKVSNDCLQMLCLSAIAALGLTQQKTLFWSSRGNYFWVFGSCKHLWIFALQMHAEKASKNDFSLQYKCQVGYRYVVQKIPTGWAPYCCTHFLRSRSGIVQFNILIEVFTHSTRWLRSTHA